MRRDEVTYGVTLILVFLGLAYIGTHNFKEVNEVEVFPQEEITYIDYNTRDDVEYLLVEASDRATKFEGFSEVPYNFRDTWHIGYGTTISGPDPDLTFTEEYAYTVLYDDMQYYHEQLSVVWGSYNSLPLEAKIVLVDMAYNMGIPNLLTFTDMQNCSTIECYQEEIADSLYAEQVPNRAQANIDYLNGA